MAFNIAKLIPPINPQARKYGREMVRKVLAANPEGVNIFMLHKLILEEKPPADYKYTIPELEPPKYTKGGQLKKPDTLPPNPEHPISSKNFLKDPILKELLQMKQVSLHRVLRPTYSTEDAARRAQNRAKMMRASVAASKKKGKTTTPTAPPKELNPLVPTYVWRLHTPPKLRPATVARHAFHAKSKVVWASYGRLVGTGEDWSHLNTRRRRARPAKVKRDLVLMQKRDRLQTNWVRAREAEKLEEARVRKLLEDKMRKKERLDGRRKEEKAAKLARRKAQALGDMVAAEGTASQAAEVHA